MSLIITWRVFGPVHEARDGAAEITKAYLHGHADGALDATANVIAVPGRDLADVGIDARSCEEGA